MAGETVTSQALESGTYSAVPWLNDFGYTLICLCEPGRPGLPGQEHNGTYLLREPDKLVHEGDPVGSITGQS